MEECRGRRQKQANNKQTKVDSIQTCPIAISSIKVSNGYCQNNDADVEYVDGTNAEQNKTEIIATTECSVGRSHRLGRLGRGGAWEYR